MLCKPAPAIKAIRDQTMLKATASPSQSPENQEFERTAAREAGGGCKRRRRSGEGFRLPLGQWTTDRKFTPRQPFRHWTPAASAPKLSIMAKHQITELLGDGIGVELRNAVHTLAEALPITIEFRPVDLSLENRKARGSPLYQEAFRTLRETRFALKYPTITADESPNAVLRRLCKFSVIHRPVYSLPGVPRNFTPEIDVEIVRVATGGTYEDGGRMIGDSGAVSMRIVEREPVSQAAVYALELGRRTRKSVTTSSKYTIQRATDGLFETIVEEIHNKAYPDVPHKKELFDALLAKIIMKPKEFQIILLPNEYGDFLSDMACGLAGSLGLGASGSYSFTPYYGIDLAMFDPTHGTAPDIAGQNKANPTAMFLALSQLLTTVGEAAAGAMIKDNVLKLLAEGFLTGDLGGKCSTTEFTNEMASRIRATVSAESKPPKGK